MTKRAALVDRLAKDTRKELSIPTFDFDALWHPGLRALIPDQVIADICACVADIKLDTHKGKQQRREYFKQLLAPYGFVRLGGGTNREVYKNLEDQSVVLKIAIDSLARNNNLAEIVKQEWIKPFCTKMYDVTPCGTLGLMERGDPIINRIQLANTADGIYRVMEYCNDKGYVVGDGGGEYFMNYVIRPGFGPVLCDYTSVYKLDFSKLRCKRRDPATGKLCGGSIDYALPAMSKIVCSTCGAVYSALDLAKEVETMQQLIQLTRSDEIMEIRIYDGDGNIIKETKKSTDTIRLESKAQAKKTNRTSKELEVKLNFCEEREDGTIVNREIVNGFESDPSYQKPEKETIKINLNEPVKSEDGARVYLKRPGEVADEANKEPNQPYTIKIDLAAGESKSATTKIMHKVEAERVEVTKEIYEDIKKPEVVHVEETAEPSDSVEEVENVQTPEPTSNGDSERLHEIVEAVREELAEKEIESKITINGKPVDFSEYEEVQEAPKETPVFDEEEDKYNVNVKFDEEPSRRVKPKRKSSMDMTMF